MIPTFEVGDVVRLSVMGLAEVATSDDYDYPGVPFGFGVVVDFGVAKRDDILVDFDGIDIQCAPNWLIPDRNDGGRNA